MLLFIDDKRNIKVYLQIRHTNRITLNYSFGKCIITSPKKLKLNELKDMYYKNESLANKYSVDYNDLYFYIFGKKYKLYLFNSNHNRVFIEDDMLYCATRNNDIDYVIKLLKDYYNNLVKEEILKIKDIVLNKIKDIFNIDLSNIILDFKYAKSYLGCNNHKKITMSGILAKYDPKYYPYVLAHEYIHEFAFNHSNDFYQKLLKIYPDYFEVMNKLKLYGKEFSFSVI